MASTYRELYDDYVQNLQQYVRNATITPVQFMRDISRGMQAFQRKTLVLDSQKQLFRVNNYDFGDDVFLIRELTDQDDNQILLQSYEQLRTISEMSGQPVQGTAPTEQPWRHETPFIYDLRRNKPETVEWYGAHTRLAAPIYNRIVLFPDLEDEFLQLFYYPDVHAFSENSPQWSAWFPVDYNFQYHFDRQTIGNQLSKYEDAFVQYACYRTMLAKNSTDAMVHKTLFDEMIADALQRKQQFFKQGTAPYNLSPF